MKLDLFNPYKVRFHPHQVRFNLYKVRFSLHKLDLTHARLDLSHTCSSKMADNIFRLKIGPDLVVLSLGFLKLERLFLEIHKILLENIINVTT